ncbi:hypothetical protein CKA32_005514 [Geitlerinema sp. FC II]|nr:hypothetical protein CKA32_005514 [Geitlerinema sp. FC II]
MIYGELIGNSEDSHQSPVTSEDSKQGTGNSAIRSLETRLTHLA